MGGAVVIIPHEKMPTKTGPLCFVIKNQANNDKKQLKK
jgi:hypothetical protein